MSLIDYKNNWHSRYGMYNRKRKVIQMRRRAMIAEIYHICTSGKDVARYFSKMHEKEGSTIEKPYINLILGQPWSQRLLQQDFDLIEAEAIEQMQSAKHRYTLQGRIVNWEKALIRANDPDNEMSAAERAIHERECNKQIDKLLRLGTKADTYSKEDVQRLLGDIMSNIKKLSPDNEETHQVVMVALEAAFTGKSLNMILRGMSDEKEKLFIERDGKNGASDQSTTIRHES